MTYHWDEMKIAPEATPLKKDKGWLNIYHGVFKTMDGVVYRLGVADEWILQPEDPWEVSGYVHNGVFTCGAVSEEDGSVKIYWGGTDTVMCGGTGKISDLVDLCLSRPRPAL